MPLAAAEPIRSDPEKLHLGAGPNRLLENGPLVGRFVMATEFFRRAVVETRMRPHVIVMAPPDFNEDASFAAAAKPFHVQTGLPLVSWAARTYDRA